MSSNDKSITLNKSTIFINVAIIIQLSIVELLYTFVIHKFFNKITYIYVLSIIILLTFYYKRTVQLCYDCYIIFKNMNKTITYNKYKYINEYSNTFKIINLVINVVFIISSMMLIPFLYKFNNYRQNNSYSMIISGFVTVHASIGIIFMIFYGLLFIIYILNLTHYTYYNSSNFNLKNINTHILNNFPLRIIDRKCFVLLNLIYDECPICSKTIYEDIDSFVELRCCAQKYHNACISNYYTDNQNNLCLICNIPLQYNILSNDDF